MPVGTGRRFHTQQVHFLRKTVNYNDAGIATDGTVLVGTMPPNSFVIATNVHVQTVFNAATTNVLLVGTAATNNALVASADVNEAAVATTRVAPATQPGLLAPTVDIDLFAVYTQTGTAATTGKAVIVVEYVPPTDL
jgi:hypothetical protein